MPRPTTPPGKKLVGLKRPHRATPGVTGEPRAPTVSAPVSRPGAAPASRARGSALIDAGIIYWGDRAEPRPLGSGPHLALEDHRASTAAYTDYMRPRCVELARVLKKTGSFYYHYDWHASHYVKVNA